MPQSQEQPGKQKRSSYFRDFSGFSYGIKNFSSPQTKARIPFSAENTIRTSRRATRGGEP
jgi:hypothetical protein